jgi:tRNA-uridine aminocarboxypropyltransferase
MCDELVVLQHRTPVMVVMHPIEIQKSSNTGQLAARVLSQAAIQPSTEPFDFGPSLLLFPHESARALTVEDAGTPLVVPDGSWRQARRIARRIHQTNGAEFVRLVDVPATRYPLRRGSRSDTLSTFEAIVEALAILEGPHIAPRLMRVFDRFVMRILSLRGHPPEH